MAKKNRVTFKTSISAKFFTNILKLIKGNTLRDAMLDTADSFLNIDSDANVNGGYMAIDNAGKTDVSKIKQDTPENKFVRDDGTFAFFQPKVNTIVSSASIVIDVDTTDCVDITALSIDVVFSIIGSPVNFQGLIVRLKDNGAPRAIDWGPDVEAKGTPLPDSTIPNKVLTVAFLYDNVSLKFGCVGAQNEV